MEKLESEIQEYHATLINPDIFQDHEKVLDIQQKLEKAQVSLDLLIEEWAELEEMI